MSLFIILVSGHCLKLLRGTNSTYLSRKQKLTVNKPERLSAFKREARATIPQYYTSFMQVLCKCFASAMQVQLCMCCAKAMQVLCKSYASAVQELCKCYASSIQVLCKCHAISIQVLDASNWLTMP